MPRTPVFAGVATFYRITKNETRRKAPDIFPFHFILDAIYQKTAIFEWGKPCILPSGIEYFTEGNTRKGRILSAKHVQLFKFKNPLDFGFHRGKVFLQNPQEGFWIHQKMITLSIWGISSLNLESRRQFGEILNHQIRLERRIFEGKLIAIDVSAPETAGPRPHDVEGVGRNH